jgi:oligosaccharide repeat unit polymerase
MTGKVLPGLFAMIAAFCVVTTTMETIYVTVPLAVGLITTLAFFWALSCRRHGSVPFELGAVYLAAVALYMAYPLIGFLALQQAYTPLNDSRLYLMQPGAAEVGGVGWLYACHLASFGIVYMLVRGRLPIQKRTLRVPDTAVLVAAAGVYAVIETYGVFVGLFFDTAATTYAETYLAARRLPLFVGQVLNHLSGAKFPLSLILLAALFGRYRKYRLAIMGWLLLVAAVTAARLGSRTDLVLLLLAAAMMYHLVVRPLAPRVVAAFGVVGLSGFIALGMLRSAQGGSLEVTSANPFVYASEFETLFANALHLNRVKPTIGKLPPAFYLADVAAVIPQQLAPFTKIDRADWYVSTFFRPYSASGGGLAFGTVSEAVLSGGWVAALVFGAALGFIFAKIHRFYARHADRFWVLVFYVWVTALGYQSFRNTTFALLVLFVYRFIPAVLLVNLLAHGIKRVARGRKLAVAAVAVNA